VCGDLPAALAIARADVLPLLAQLVDKSLVVAEEGRGEVRYRLLETVRQYAAERLADDPEDDEASLLRERHAEHYLGLAEVAAAHLRGPAQAHWLARLAREHDDLRAALRWAAVQGRVETEARLCVALARFWVVRGHLAEGNRWIEGAVARGAGVALPAGLRGRLLRRAGTLAWNRGDLARAAELSGAALTLFRQIDDRGGMAEALLDLAIAAAQRGDFARAMPLFDESRRLHEAVGDALSAANVLQNMGSAAMAQGDRHRAEEHFTAALRGFRAASETRGIANVLHGLGNIAINAGDTGRAAALARECLQRCRELGDTLLTAATLQLLGYARLIEGEPGEATAHFAEALRLARDAGDRRYLTYSLEHLAAAAAQRGHAARAARLFGAAAAARLAWDLPLGDYEQASLERRVAEARAAADEAAWGAAWAAGQAQPLEEVVAEALRAAGEGEG
jgi:tetratricopeptide (TPR) repeat protein